MTPTKEIPFTFRAGHPIVVDVVGQDGKPYEIRMGLSLIRVGDNGEIQPSLYGPVPKFEVQVQLVLDTRPKGQ